MSRKFTYCLLLLTGLLGACVPQTQYNWGNYEDGLFNYYKDPEALDALMEALDATIAKGEADKPVPPGQRVPPGLYAEYGYLLMVNGRRDEAAIYFNKEKSIWPESTFLMDKLIAAATDEKSQTKNDNTNLNRGYE